MTKEFSMRKVVASGMIGNGLEWYDYALYAHVARLISIKFFPGGDSSIAYLETFGVFAIGFLVRPLGAMLFGYIGDKFGRKIALTGAILMMAIPTALIGILPTYAQIGMWAPICLTIIRLLQGLSLGGEFSGSITFLVEHGANYRRGLIGSTSPLSLCIGILMGSLVMTTLSHILTVEDFEMWGWRLPFILGILVGGVGLYIRSNLHESPKYLHAKAEGHLEAQPLRTVFKEYYKELLIATGVYLTVTVPFYTLAVFLNSFMQQLGHSIQDALVLNTIAMLIVIIIIPYSAMLSDKVGRKPVLIASAAVLFVTIYPIFLLLSQPGFIGPLIAHIVFALIVGVYIAPVPALLVELFPTRIRYSGMGLAYNICAALFGGTMPVVVTWLMKVTQITTIGAIYIMICAAISLWVLAKWYEDKSHESLA